MGLDVNRPKSYRRGWNGGRNLVKQPLTAAEWNALYPVGTSVIVVKDMGEMLETTTRSEAFDCNAGYPVIFLDAIRGYYLLDRVAPTGKTAHNSCGDAGKLL